MFFAFPEDAHWNAERQAVEFGGEIGSRPSSWCKSEQGLRRPLVRLLGVEVLPDRRRSAAT